MDEYKINLFETRIRVAVVIIDLFTNVHMTNQRTFRGKSPNQNSIHAMITMFQLSFENKNDKLINVIFTCALRPVGRSRSQRIEIF
jgi:hypothetical protein